MRKLHAATLVTLDGVMQDPGGFGESDFGGWAGPHFTEEAVRDAVDQLAAADTFLCGRVTYELLSRAWSGNTGEYLGVINKMPKLVASTTLREPLEWNATLIKGDVAENLTALKRRPGKDIVMYGSATLMRTLMRHNLVDTFKISVFPMVLGQGTRLFPEGFTATTLQLADVKTLRSGVTILTYQHQQAPQAAA
ncbi:dihydrofolate reductase family protein [Spirillospora sp. CA-294931]|uniref:dihydrofolate reductase family protein n=1 Tax=Spirillospora sp. CA-294931 TaxID=3240042 RepID=UPI003D89F1DF